MALAQQFPGIGTSVTVPETFTPLFAAAGYTPLSLQQYEMTMDLPDAKSALAEECALDRKKNSTGRR